MAFSKRFEETPQTSLQLERYDTRLSTYRQNNETDLALLLKAYKPQIDEMKRLRVCYTCKQQYRAAENFMGYGCRTHRGEFGLDGRWECCGQRAGHLGCLPAIHVGSREAALAIHYNYIERKLKIPIELIDFEIIPSRKDLFEDYTFNKDERDPDQKFYQMPCVLLDPKYV